LGADPAVAWSTAPDLPAGSVDAQTDALLRLARRSASSGAALADGVAELADQCRDDAAHAATAAAERAGVLIAGPLGLCFCRHLCAWALFLWWPGWPVMSCSRACCES